MNTSELAKKLMSAANTTAEALDRLNAFPGDGLIDLSQHEGEQVDADITTINEWYELASPANVKRLVDELEGRDALVALQKIEIRETHGELEKAREGERQWREVVDAFCADDADWHKLTNSNNELISFLSVALCKQDDRVTELESFRTAYMEWSDKTDWMQGDKRFDVVKPLGKHRADVLKAYVEHLESRLDSANKLQDSAFRHGLQCGFSFGQTNDQAGFEQSMSAYGSQEKDNG